MSNESKLEIVEFVGENPFNILLSERCPVNEAILSNIAFHTEGHISELYLNIHSRTDLHIYTHLTKGLAPGQRRVEFPRPWNVLPGSRLAFMATSSAGNSPLDCSDSTQLRNHTAIGELHFGDEIDLQEEQGIEMNIKFLAFVYRANYMFKFYSLYETPGLREIKLLLQPEEEVGSIELRHSVEVLNETSNSRTIFRLLKYDYSCCEKTTVQLFPLEYELKNFTQFYWKLLCINGAQKQTSGPILEAFFPTPTICQVVVTIHVEEQIAQTIYETITFHACQLETVQGYLRMKNLLFRPYLADISLFTKESSNAIELDDNQSAILCNESVRFEVSEFATMATKAVVVITHKETGTFDTLIVSSVHPACYLFHEVGTYLIQSTMTSFTAASFSYHLVKISSRPPELAIYLRESVLEVDVVSILFVMYASLSQQTCICVDQGDGRSIVRPPKDHALHCYCCSANAIVLDNESITTLTCLPLLYHVAGKYNLTIAVREQYKFMALRTMNLTVIDRTRSCKPWVRFSDPKLRDPFHPLQLLFTEQYIIHCDVSVASRNCSIKRRYVWRIWLKDANNTVDVQSVTEFDTGSLAKLHIKPRSLDAGFYHVSLSAQDQYPNGRTETVHVDDGFLQIISTPLIIRLLNTSMSRVSISQESPNLCLLPEVYSIVPSREGKEQSNLLWEGFGMHGAYVSANATLVLNGRCSKKCPKPYQWRIFEVHGETTTTELMPKTLRSSVKGWKDETLIIRSSTFAKHLERMSQEESRFLRVCFSAGNCTNNACPSNCRDFVPVGMPPGYTCDSNATARIKFNTSICIFCKTPQSSRLLRFRYDVGNSSARSTIATSYAPHFCTTLPYSNAELYYFVRIYGQYNSYVEHRFGPMTMEELTKEELFAEIANATSGAKEVEVERELASGGINDISRVLRSITALMDAAQHIALEDEAQSDVVALMQMLTRMFIPITNSMSDEEVLQLISQIAVAGMRMLEGLKLQLDSPLPLEVNSPQSALNYDTDIEAVGKLVLSRCFHKCVPNKAVVKHQPPASEVESQVVAMAIGELNAALAGAMQLGATTYLAATTSDGGSMHLFKISNLPQLYKAADKLNKIACSSFSVLDLASILDEYGTIIIQCTITMTNVYSFGNTEISHVPKESETITLSAYANGLPLEIKNRRKPFRIRLYKNHDFQYPKFTTGLDGDKAARLSDALIAVDGSRVYEPLIMFSYLIEDADVAFSLEFQAPSFSAKSCPQFLVVARHIFPPNLNSYWDGWGEDFWSIVPPQTSICRERGVPPEEVERNYTFFVSNVDFHRAKLLALQLARDVKMTKNDTNTFFVGYRQLNEEEVDRYSQENPPPRPYPYESQINVTAYIRAFVSSCNYLEAKSKVWSTSGCKVTRETAASVVVCECNHLTTFSAGFNPLVPVKSLPRGHLNCEHSEKRLAYPSTYALLLPLLIFALSPKSVAVRAFWVSALLTLVTAFLFFIS
ncbi:hypothetical protein TcWFU_006126 [Taenia crassiceps]|uniref:GPS domain-containing protein n=1 Tax=Taenia crassiceps TaxID=6207 RepID=A0ABR4Q804_9CEST